MSLNLIPNMPVVFNENLETCACHPEWNQLSELGDEIQFQVKFSPSSSATQLLEDPTFRTTTTWATSGAFSTAGKGLMCKADTGSSGTFGQYNVFTIGKIYQVTINVREIFGTIEIFNGSFKVGDVTGLGTNTFIFEAQSPNLTFSMTGNYGYDSCCVLSVYAYELNKFLAFTILDANGNWGTLYDYDSNPEFFTFAKDSITVTFKWTDVGVGTEGCYRIGVADPILNRNAQFGVTNPKFELWEWRNDYGFAPYPVGWYETGVRYVNRYMMWSTTLSQPHMSLYIAGGSTPPGASQFSDLGVVLGEGLTYNVTLQIASLNSRVFIKAGTTLSSPYTTTGIYNFQITAGGPNPRLTVSWEPLNLSSAIMDVYQLVVTLADEQDFVFDLISNQFKVAETHPCTKLINISQDDDAFGAVFEGSNFAPRFRAECALVNSGYKFKREFTHDSDGGKKVFFGERRKSQILKFEQLPTYLHDFLSLALIADYFFVDGKSYFVEDEEYSPDYPDSITNLAAVQMEVSETTQNVVNTDVGNTPNPIAVAPSGEDNLIGFPPNVQDDTIIEWATNTQILIP